MVPGRTIPTAGFKDLAAPDHSETTPRFLCCPFISGCIPSWAGFCSNSTPLLVCHGPAERYRQTGLAFLVRHRTLVDADPRRQLIGTI